MCSHTHVCLVCTCCLHSWPSSSHSLGGSIEFKISSVSLRLSTVSGGNFECAGIGDGEAFRAEAEHLDFCGCSWETETKRLIKTLEIFINLLCSSGILLHIVRYRCAKTK